MKSKPFGALFGLLALVAILGVAPAFGQTAVEIDMTKGAGSSATADCVAAKNCFDPSAVSIAPGTTVTWKNTDTVSHYVTSGQPSDNTTGTVFDSGNLIKPGSSYQFTFADAGTFNYFCTVHPWMVGQVIVGGAAAPTSTTPATTPDMTGGNMTTPAVGNQSGIPLGPPYTAPSNSTSAGNAAVPEFGPVAGIVLAIAVLSMVVFAAK
ncbi:MAG: cupredoxin domain-containing protein, partial [Thaumarchaeota archaeon]|nr:cupredoxin domain-containing protein [Nitrososphaerota archaeon]